MRDNVMFNGNKNGLKLLLNASVEFDTIKEELKSKLDSAANFFAKGCKVNILPKNGCFSEDEQNQLSNLLEDYGLCYNHNSYSVLQQECNQSAPAKNSLNIAKSNFQNTDGQYTTPDSDENHTLMVTKVLRGGQKLIYSGTVMVMGNVNPTAQIIAGGDIIILGTCWGLVHAGAFGNTAATITASKLVASQIRIADYIAIAPDKFHNPEHPETARISKNKLIIEPQTDDCLAETRKPLAN